MISRKCDEQFLHSPLPLLLDAFNFPLQYGLSDSDCLMSSCHVSLITFRRSLRFANGSCLPSQTSSYKISQTD